MVGGRFITTTKITLGFGEKSGGAYKQWRTSVKCIAGANARNQIDGSKHPGFSALVEQAIDLDTFPSVGRANIAAEKVKYPGSASLTCAHHAAVRALVSDCIKKTNETSKKRKAEDGPVDEELGDVEDARASVSSNASRQWSVEFYIRDPDQYVPANVDADADDNDEEGVNYQSPPEVIAKAWHDRNIRELATIEEATVLSIIRTLQELIPEGRKVRALIGMLIPGNPPVTGDNGDISYSLPTDFESLKTDAAVFAWLTAVQGKPIKMLVELHRNARENSPPPPGRTKAYFPVTEFQEYEDEASDSEPYRLQKPKGALKRVMPRTDRVFTSRVTKLRRKIQKLQMVEVQLTNAWRTKFPPIPPGTGPIFVEEGPIFEIQNLLQIPPENARLWIHMRGGLRDPSVLLAYTTAVNNGHPAAVALGNGLRAANVWMAANPLP